ncbi:MAG TPA: ABC-2 family transporter protein, partial [Chloroflexia bacterium]|nr:ABC-2 family transporter protein [Chloroflexia bacterium]
ASSAVALSFSFLWGSLAFWAPRAAEEISTSSNRFMDNLKAFPLEGLAPVLVGGLVTVLPVGFVAWYPCRVLLGIDQGPLGPLITPLAAAVLAAITFVIFQRGMRYYGRTGSQRYSGFGHRG